MRIALVSREYPPESLVGGIGTYTHHVARALAGRGHEVFVVAETAGSRRVTVEEGVAVHRLARPGGAVKELRMLSRARLVAREIALIGGLEVVQACEYGAEGYELSRRPGAARTPLVTRLATPRFLIDEIEGRTSWRGRLFADRFERAQTRGSARIISSTHALAARVGRAWGIRPEQIDVVPNALDLTRVRALGAATPVLPVPPGSFVVYFGRLEERKGVHVLAEAMRPVLKDHPDLHMVFAGADRPWRGGTMGGYVRATLSEAGDRVTIHDLQPQDRLLPLVASASVAALPSLWEAFGFVVVEAMALGVPVVATSGSGFAEIIEDGRSGLLTRPGDARSLEAAIRSLVENPVRRDAIGRAGSRRAEDFDTGRVCERLEGVYAAAIAGRAA